MIGLWGGISGFLRWSGVSYFTCTLLTHSAGGRVSRACSDPSPTRQRRRQRRNHCNLLLCCVFARSNGSALAVPVLPLARSNTTLLIGAMPCVLFVLFSHACKSNSCRNLLARANALRPSFVVGCNTVVTVVVSSRCACQLCNRCLTRSCSAFQCCHLCSRNVAAGSTAGCVRAKMTVATRHRAAGTVIIRLCFRRVLRSSLRTRASSAPICAPLVRASSIAPTLLQMHAKLFVQGKHASVHQLFCSATIAF